MADELSMKELREQGKEFGLAFGPGTTKVQAAAAIEQARSNATPQTDTAPRPAGDDQTATDSSNASSSDARPDTTDDAASSTADTAAAGDEADQPTAEGRIRRPIVEVTDRGDWRDPFSGLMTFHGNDRNPESGAVRDGDEAVLPVAQETADDAGR